MFTAGQVPQDEWSHIAAVDDGKTVRIYLNGTQVVEEQTGGDWSAWGGPLCLGTSIYYDEPRNGFAGRIAGCSYWSKALQENEIQQLARSGPFAVRNR